MHDLWQALYVILHSAFLDLHIFRAYCYAMHSPDKYPVLASPLQYCTVCDDGPPLKFEDRAEDKEPLTIYGLNGSYQVLILRE